jgi:hypothetical protein
MDKPVSDFDCNVQYYMNIYSFIHIHSFNIYCNVNLVLIIVVTLLLVHVLHCTILHRFR